MDEHQKLFNAYIKLQSKEFKKDILGYEKFTQEGHDLIIKVNLKNGGWLRVYKTRNGEIEWY